MGKFDGILICTDLDGTLYRNDKTISEENKEAIEYFKREGGYFTFITGRMPYYSHDAYNAAKPNVPFGCINGGGVYDGERKEYVWTRELPAGFLGMVECVDKAFPDVGIHVCTFEKTYFSKDNRAMEIFRQRTGLPNLVCPYREVKEPIAKILFGIDDEQELGDVMKTLREHPDAKNYDLVRSENWLFEILPKGVNKGLALSKLVEHLGVDPKRTVGIGDYNNDIGLFKSAAVGIAVSNACEEALEAADFVTVSNEEHAIAQVIYDIENNKYPISLT